MVTTGASDQRRRRREPGVDDDPATEDRWTGRWHGGQPTPGVSAPGGDDADEPVEHDVAVLVDVVGEGAGDGGPDGLSPVGVEVAP